MHRHCQTRQPSKSLTDNPVNPVNPTTSPSTTLRARRVFTDQLTLSNCYLNCPSTKVRARPCKTLQDRQQSHHTLGRPCYSLRVFALLTQSGFVGARSQKPCRYRVSSFDDDDTLMSMDMDTIDNHTSLTPRYGHRGTCGKLPVYAQRTGYSVRH